MLMRRGLNIGRYGSFLTKTNGGFTRMSSARIPEMNDNNHANNEVNNTPVIMKRGYINPNFGEENHFKAVVEKFGGMEVVENEILNVTKMKNEVSGKMDELLEEDIHEEDRRTGLPSSTMVSGYAVRPDRIASLQFYRRHKQFTASVHPGRKRREKPSRVRFLRNHYKPFKFFLEKIRVDQYGLMVMKQRNVEGKRVEKELMDSNQ